MNAELLLQHFDRLSEAPDAVPRLRRFILDLAVRGKLVEQDPDDEPVRELLKRVEEAREAVVRSGQRTPKSYAVISLDEQPYLIPNTWTWVRLGNYGVVVGGGTPPSTDAACFAEAGEGIPWLTPADLGKSKKLFIGHGTRDLTEQGLKCSSAQLMPAGAVLFTSRAPIGYTAIAAIPVATNQGFKSIVPFLLESSRYIALYFKAFAHWIDEQASGTTFKEVSGKIVGNLPFPLPSLAEQHRIVAKVDELMAICDELEAAQAKRESRRDRLVAATLHGLNNGDNGTEKAQALSFAESARFYFNHMPKLTTKPEHIKQLRQTILNLAVRGKLVEQDPNDEPAPILLSRVREKKSKLIDQGIIRWQPLYGRVMLEDRTYEIPCSWEWVRLGDVVADITSGSRGWADYYSDSGAAFIRSQNVKSGYLDLTSLAHVSLPLSVEGKRTAVGRGDVLVVITGDVGNAGVIEGEIGEAYVSQHVGLISALETSLSEWLLISILAPVAGRGEITNSVYGGRPGLNLSTLRMLKLPLPPQAEQHRIVSKVNEMFLICDYWEEQLLRKRAACYTTLERLLDLNQL